jgi:hypothetical protein
VARFRSPISTTLEVVGLASVAVGLGLVSLPAGIIAAGIGLCMVGYLIGD